MVRNCWGVGISGVSYSVMITVTEIQIRLGSFLAGDMNEAVFYKWLMDETWNMHKDSSQEAQDLVIDLQVAFWERHEDHASKDRQRRLESWFQKEVLRIFAESHLATAVDLYVTTSRQLSFTNTQTI